MPYLHMPYLRIIRVRYIATQFVCHVSGVATQLVCCVATQLVHCISFAASLLLHMHATLNLQISRLPLVLSPHVPHARFLHTTMQQRLAHQYMTTEQSLVNLVFVFAIWPFNQPSHNGGINVEHARPQHCLAGHNNRLMHNSAMTQAILYVHILRAITTHVRRVSILSCTHASLNPMHEMTPQHIRMMLARPHANLCAPYVPHMGTNLYYFGSHVVLYMHRY